MSIPVTTAAGRVVFIHQPDPGLLARTVRRIMSDTIEPGDVPPRGSDCVKSDNAAWILGNWLTGQWDNPRDKEPRRQRNVAADLFRRNPGALYLLVESYLVLVDDLTHGGRKSYEQACCDGSTWVPDAMMPCGVWTKDPAAMAHDYAFDLHHADAPAASGHVWTLAAANDAYCDIYRAAGMPIVAAVRRAGLWVFADGYWNRGQSRGGLAREST